MIDFDRRLFNIDIPSDTPTKGSLLVAEPFLREDYFRHSVISIIDHGEGAGTMGVGMNRQTAYPLQSLIQGINRKKPIEVFCGGPMSGNRLYFLHTLGEIIPASTPVASGLFVGGDFHSIIEYINQGYPIEGFLRFFLGYSGWSPGQLEEEVANNVWAVAPLSEPSSLLTGSEDAYWHRYVRQLGESHKGWLYHPQNPHAN